jgi:glycosyltransferase involved in cell wall biosynthesis
VDDGQVFLDNQLEKIESLVDAVEDWSVLPAEPMVSVCMITYNHEEFIREAVDSILMQQTTFAYELVIGEDKSTDRTREIVQEYQLQYPNKIRLRLAKENLYSQNLKPFTGVLIACRGRYIALCEGDDYWTDPLKLQKQVELMDDNQECSMCFHRAFQLDQESGNMKILKPSLQKKKKIYTLNDIVLGDFIPTATIMLRNGLVPEFPSWFNECFVGDWPLQIIYAQKGSIRFIDQAMSAYRVHSGGIMSGENINEICQKLITTVDIVSKYIDKKYKKKLKYNIACLLTTMAYKCAERGDLLNARIYLQKSIYEYPFIFGKQSLDRYVMISRLYTPFAYKIVKNIQNHII